MQNKKLIFLAVLTGAAILSLTYGVLAPPASKTRRASAAKMDSLVPAVSETLKPIRPLTLLTRHPRKSDFGTWGPNPFLPRQVPKSQDVFTDVNLHGIAWDPKNPSALINDQVVGVGDEIEGNKVIAITKNSVLLNDGEQDFKLALGSKIHDASVSKGQEPEREKR